MFQDQRYLQSLHECYRDVYSEEQKPLPLDRMKKRADSLEGEARRHDMSAKAWDAIEADRNKGIRGLGRRVARKYAGPSFKDQFIDTNRSMDKLQAADKRVRRKIINNVADTRLQFPQEFSRDNQQAERNNKAKSTKNSIRRFSLNREEYEYLLDCLVYEGYAEDYESAVNIAESMSDGWIESYFSEDAYDSVVADLKKQYGDSAIITKPNPRKNKAARRVANAMNKRSDDSPLYADGTTKASQGRYKPNKPGQFTYHGD